MRAWEFIETDPTIVSASLASLGDTKKPPITLRYLNKLKCRRKRREAEFARKRPFIAYMYGDPEQQAEAVKDELAREEDRHEIEMLKQEMELLSDRPVNPLWRGEGFVSYAADAA